MKIVISYSILSKVGKLADFYLHSSILQLFLSFCWHKSELQTQITTVNFLHYTSFLQVIAFNINLSVTCLEQLFSINVIFN